MAKTKFDFISELLESKKLASTQKEKLLALAIEEFKKKEPEDERIWKEINSLKELISLKQLNIETEIQNSNKNNLIEPQGNITKKRNSLKHDPQKINSLLTKFKDNTVFKWTTHPWDEKKFLSIEDFIEELNKNKKYLSKIFNCNRDLYSLINYFLFNPGIEVNENGVPSFGWKNLNEIKLGWQYPNNILIDWCKQNFNNNNGKKPFQFEIPPHLKPSKLIKGIKIQTFENVVDVFKTEIQFRDNYLIRELSKKQKSLLDFSFKGIEKLDKLDFYTYTPGILTALDIILDQIKKIETDKTIEFDFIQEKDNFTISIAHLNSFPTKRLNRNNPKSFLGGQLNEIARSLFSLCDYSILSNFEDEDRKSFFGEIKILYPNVEAIGLGKKFEIITDPEIAYLNEAQPGFIHSLKFYL